MSSRSAERVSASPVLISADIWPGTGFVLRRLQCSEFVSFILYDESCVI